MGGGGGGAETTWEEGSDAQPAISATAPQATKRRAIDGTLVTSARADFIVFIPDGRLVIKALVRGSM